MFGLSKVEKIKKHYAIEQVIGSYGIKLSGSGTSLKGLCPFHPDKTPSLSVTPSVGKWYCFGCGAGGSVIDFVAGIEKIADKAAIDQLAAALNDNGNIYRPSRDSVPEPLEQAESPEPVEGVKQPVVSEILSELCRIYHHCFAHHEAAQQYLAGRGISDPELWKRYQIGYVNGSALADLVPVEGPLREQLIAMGILNNRGNESFYKCVTFPVTDESGAIVNLYGRSIEGTRQHYLKGGNRGVWNHQALTAFDTIIVTESIIDALSLLQLGIGNVIPLYGTNGLRADHLRLLMAHRPAEIIFALDNDDAGRRAIVKLAKRLAELAIPLSTIELPNSVKDPNAFLVAGGTREQFENLLAERTGVESLSPEASALDNPSLNPPINPAVEQGDIANLVYVDKSEAHFAFDMLFYRIRGLRLTAADTMRVVVMLDTGAGRHTDRLDLYVSKSRRSFANVAAARLDVQAAQIEEQLLVIIEGIEHLQRRAITESDNSATHLNPMTDAERDEALALLRTPQFLDHIAADLERCGYVGEDIGKKLCYLSATSRITAKPLSIIVRSSSAAGKSELMDKVAELMPPEDIEFFSRISPQALYYMEKDQLKHKLLIIDERAGAEEADYPIRTLQSRDKLTLAVVMKDPASGKQRTVRLEMSGPTAIWESTTESTINSENASRCFELYLDESVTQTTRVHRAQRNAFSADAWQRDQQRCSIIRTHRNAQRLLRPLKVDIPYRDKLAFPASWMRTRRDNLRFLSLIAMVTLIHQYQRTIITAPNGDEYVESTVDDYETAYELAVGVLASSLSPIAHDAQHLLAMLFTLVADNANACGIKTSEYLFSRRQVREHTSWSEAKVRRALNELAGMEYIAAATGRRGSSYRYRLLVEPADLSDSLNELTTPDQLRQALREVNAS